LLPAKTAEAFLRSTDSVLPEPLPKNRHSNPIARGDQRAAPRAGHEPGTWRALEVLTSQGLLDGLHPATVIDVPRPIYGPETGLSYGRHETLIQQIFQVVSHLFRGVAVYGKPRALGVCGWPAQVYTDKFNRSLCGSDDYQRGASQSSRRCISAQIE
jgi:hypothetical protein